MRVHFQQRHSIAGSGELVSVECYGATSAWAVGPEHLLRSADGGKRWTDSYFSSHLHIGTNPCGVAFYSADEGVLLAKKGPMEVIYYRTENGGKTWVQARKLREGGYVWTNLFALRDSGKVWSLIKRRNGEAFVEILNTKDGLWSRSPAIIRGQPCQILFLNESKGWILERWNKDSWIDESPHVPRTTTVLHESNDGGASWQLVSKAKCSGRKLSVIDDRKLLIVGDDGVFSSEDFGRTWCLVPPRPRVQLFDVHFQGVIGAAVGTEGLIGAKADVLLQLSMDAGKSWTEVEPPTADSFFGVRMTTWSTGILASDKALYSFDFSS